MREYQVFSGLVVEPKNLGRRISRRLSLVARVPTFIQSKFRPADPDAGESSANIRKWPQQLRKARPITVHMILPNGVERTITAPGKCTVRQLIQPVALELHICEFRLRTSDTLALLSPHAEASLLDGDTIILEDATRVRDERGEVDARFRLTEDLVDTEREFLVSFRTIYDVYARPLKKLCSISEDEQKQLFGGVEPILSVSNMLLTKLEDALASWDPLETRIGTLFSKQFWAQFEEYYHFFTQAKELLREKQYRDEEFVEICKLRQGAALHTLDSLLELPIQRLASYERYFQDLLCETNADHPDLEEVHKARDKAQELVKRCEEEINQLDRVQNLFPNDQLYLHDKDALSVKMKGLIRKRSTTAARLQRAFSSKGLRNPPTSASSPSSSSDMTDNSTSVSTSAHSTPVKTGVDKRQFIMETAVQFINGLQSQDRHLFLFNDLLLIAKARSGGNFKLKDKVRISELWLATCVDEIAEVSKSRDTSFVIGWPTINVVATFSSAALRDLWWNKLGQVIQEEREKEPKSTIIQFSYHDAVHCIGYSKTLSISSTDTVRDCIKLVLSHLEMSNLDANGFRLWVKTAADESPYPLIGHEFPFAIKMNCLREFISNEEGFDLDHCNNIYNVDPATRCQFILKSVQKPNFGVTNSNGVGAGKSYSKNNKGKKSPTRIQKVFRRVQSKPDSLEMIGNATAGFFAQPLSKICSGDKLPQPLIDMLLELRSKGPQTVGIFRKSANARQVREIRERIDGGEGIDWGSVNAVVTAVVFKDFLRSLPDSLLGSALYDQWLQVATMESIEIALDKIKSLCDRLPSANLCLLRHFLCVLMHIANNSSQNMMSASNLAVCVGPSLLWANCTASSAVSPAMALSAEATASKQVPALVAMLIDKCTLLFGTETANLLGDSTSNGSKAAVASTPQSAPVNERRIPHKDYRSKAPVQKHMARHGLLQHDSGNEESDSLHSLHHMDVMRRDDSSIDSLERELLGDPEAFDGDHAIHLRRDKMSVTNLSRDSGLTLSDTQLYTPDEDIGSESSSSGRGSDRDKSRNIRDVMRPRVNHTPNRAEQTRSMYVPTHTKSASRLDAHSQHGKVMATYSAATSYTPVYDHRQDIYRKLSDDVVYAVPKATPTVILGEEYQEPSNPNFQRQDWFRRKSHSKKQSGNVKFESPPMGLRRSASDESLANHNVISSPMTTESQNKKPASHRKGRAPLPPSMPEPRRMDSTELSRSKSDANLDIPDSLNSSKVSVGKDTVDYRTSVPVNTPGTSKLSNGHARSQSTPHIDEVDRSYDSSTLSDDDSTPHVSRSNSRGKDYRAVNSAWETAYGALSVPVPAPIHIIVSQDGSGSIVYPALNRNGNDSKSTSSKKSEHDNEDYGRKNTRKSSDKSVDADDSIYRTPASSNGRNKDVSLESSASAKSRKTESGRRNEAESARNDERASDRSRLSSSTPRSGTADSSLSGSDRYAKSSDHSTSERIYEKNHSRSREERRSSHQHVHQSHNHSSRSPIYGTPHSGRYGDYDTVLHSSSRSHERFTDDGSAASTQSSSRHGTPDIPTYEEALIRRRMPQNWTTWKDNTSNLLQVRASPIRLSSQNQDSWNDADQSMTSIPPPLPPKSDPPPLPPKQRIHLRTNPYVSPVKMRQSSTAVNRTRPVTIHMDASILNLSAVDSPPPSLPKKERSPNRRRGSNVSVVAIENNYTPLHRSFAFSTHNLRHQMENAHKEDWVKEEQDALGFKMRDQEIQTSGHWAPYFCEIETQTSLSPQPSISSDDAKSDVGLCRSEGTNTDNHINATPVTVRSERRTENATGGRSDKNHVRAESNGPRYEKNSRVSSDVSSGPTKMRAERPKKEANRSDAAVETDRRGRDRTREGGAATLQRSQSLPPLEKPSSDDSESESLGSASSDGEEEARDAITPTSQALRRAEISWSVSQLRALFSGNSPSSVPPPYRSPPAHLSCPTPTNRKRAESTDSYGEESYV